MSKFNMADIMDGKFYDKVKIKAGQKLYESCRYKGTFTNCGPDICYSCHLDSVEEISKDPNKLLYVRAWKWLVRKKKYVKLWACLLRSRK